MMQSFISKIQEQSPVNSTLVRCAESLNPVSMAISLERENNLMFDALVEQKLVGQSHDMPHSSAEEWNSI
tara:strand:+ start:92 stop:301 length:210 start_codon:yes stop_codon:yes gene_type:complete